MMNGWLDIMERWLCMMHGWLDIYKWLDMYRWLDILELLVWCDGLIDWLMVRYDGLLMRNYGYNGYILWKDGNVWWMDALLDMMVNYEE